MDTHLPLEDDQDQDQDELELNQSQPEDDQQPHSIINLKKIINRTSDYRPTGVGLLPILIQRLLLQSHSDRMTSSAILCNPNILHIRSTSTRSKLGPADWAWGCGYRNLQMLFSTLISRDEYRKVLSTHPLLNNLFAGDRDLKNPLTTTQSQEASIPNIQTWQRIIEDGWKAGFDPEGAEHFSGQLLGKKKWIGTTEIYVALCRLGIRRGSSCQIVDFPNPSGPDGQHVKLIQWVEDYFKSPSKSTDQHQSNHQLTSSTSSNSQQICEDKNLPIQITSKFPLYFQHEGHSRTIIGIESDSNLQSQLLILDPAKRVSSALKQVSEYMITTANSSSTNPAASPSNVEVPIPSSPKRSVISQRSFPSLKLLPKWPTSSAQPSATKPTLDTHHHSKLLAPYRLNLKSLSKKKQYQILYVLDQRPASFDADQTQFHTIQSIRIT